MTMHINVKILSFALFVACMMNVVMAKGQHYCHDGAKARVEFHVTDDRGAPVVGARVDGIFDMVDRTKAVRAIGHTDTNGVCVVEGQTNGVLEYSVECEGYYSYRNDKWFFGSELGCEVKFGRWQPWGGL